MRSGHFDLPTTVLAKLLDLPEGVRIERAFMPCRVEYPPSIRIVVSGENAPFEEMEGTQQSKAHPQWTEVDGKRLKLVSWGYGHPPIWNLPK